MKVALMQPYFFPYIGYFQLIQSVDEFVIFDKAQYVRRSWMNRNQILNEHKEKVFINLPVKKAARETMIKNVVVYDENQWQKKLLNQLSYYSKSPNFQSIYKFVEDCLSNRSSSLNEINSFILKKVCSLLKIETKITILSEQYPFISEANTPDQWGVDVSKALGANTYINAIGGKEFYDQQKYFDNDIDIKFIKPNLTPYKQYNNSFTPGLSIIDVLMFNDFESISRMIVDYELVN